MAKDHNKTGRSKGNGRFVMLEHWLLDSPAWLSLTPAERAVYVVIARRYNGNNNGEMSLSVREAARLCHIAKGTAAKAMKALEEKGFIKINQKGAFDYKVRHATTWVLTACPLKEREPATKDFMNWGKKQIPVLDQGQTVPSNRTDGPKA